MIGTQPWTPPATWRSRIPEDFPYVVRPNGPRYAKIFGGLLAFLLISPFVVWVAVNVILGPPWAGMSWIIWFSPLANAGIIAFLWSVSAGGGPRLAIGPEGAWLRAVHWPVQAIFLRWTDVEAVWLSSRSGLCFLPRDPGLIAGLGRRAMREARTQHRRHGAPLVVPLGKHSDRPTEDVIAAVLHYAAGRVYLAPGPWR